MQAPDRFSDASDALHEAATAQTGLADFGPDDYREGLAHLLDALDVDSAHRFAPGGREIATELVVRELKARLFTQQGWREHPEYADAPIRRPVIIVGLPRTGSTALHKLLSLDPQFQGPELWLLDTPKVRPPREKWHEDPDYRASVLRHQEILAHIPEMAHIHPPTPDMVEECALGLGQTFVDFYIACVLPVPTYEAWWLRQEQRVGYARYHDTLRLLGFGDDRCWLLKNPGHLFQMEALFETFPDARIVHTHRDPAKSIPSVASGMVVHLRGMLGDAARPRQVGIHEAERWWMALHRSEAVRRTRPDQFADVHQRELRRDTVETMRRLYAQLDLELSPETEKRMTEWVAEQDAARTQEHVYRAADFGLEEGAIHEMFADYIERYDVR